MTHQYNDPAHKHAVTQVGSLYYCYDANGNMTKRGAANSACSSGGDTLTYDQENRLTSIAVGANTTTYVYDGDGNRAKKTSNGVSTYYVGNHYEVTNGNVLKYYYFGKQRVAMRTGAGVASAALFGVSEGVPMSALFAATYPERTTALVLYGGYAKRRYSEDYPWAPTAAERQVFFDEIEKGWGGVVDLETMAPSAAHDERFKQWWATYLRRSASPKRALALARMNTEIDIRSILPAIRVPTLLVHRTGDRDSDVRGVRWMATQIPDARFVELDGADHIPFVGDSGALLDEIQEFLTGKRAASVPDKVLGTLLFTDIVASTPRAAELGNARWADLVETHFQVLRRELERFRGQEVQTTGDGILATFDGPARAVQCGRALCEAVRPLGIEIRVGLHTGEYERIGREIAGLAIHIAARVMSNAGASEVWVSSTVKDLIAGSGIEFTDRGVHTLKGIDGEWRLFSVAG